MSAINDPPEDDGTVDRSTSGEAEVVPSRDGHRVVKARILIHPEEDLDPANHPGTSTEEDVCYFRAALALFQLSKHELPFLLTHENVG